MRAMLKLKTVFGSLVAMSLTASVASAAPDWCKDASNYGVSEATKYDWKWLEQDDASHAMRILVGAYCRPNQDTERDAKLVDAAFKNWSAKLSMSESDWADAVAYMNARYGGNLAVTNPKAGWSKWSPIDQYIGIQASSSVNPPYDQSYVADALDDKLTALGRAAYVKYCVHSQSNVAFAMCQADIDAYDRKAIAAELRSDATHDAWSKMSIRLDLYALDKKLAEHAKKVKALVASDQAYSKMFELAAAARKEFASKVDPKLLELVLALDEAKLTKSRKASDGCFAKTWPAFQAAVSALPAKAYDGLIDDRLKARTSPMEQALALVVQSPNGYLAGSALYYCTSFDDKQDFLSRMLGVVMAYSPGYRGPRNAAHMAIRAANITLDDRDARLTYPDLTRSMSANASAGGGGKGEIAKVTIKGDTAVIEFANVKTKQQDCIKGHETRRLRQIQSDGTLVYEYVCDQWKTVTIDQPPFAAQTVKSIYATGLKKGMFVHTTEDVVTHAYAKNGAKVPAFIAGVAVK
jgi:hypothetical protein